MPLLDRLARPSGRAARSPLALRAALADRGAAVAFPRRSVPARDARQAGGRRPGGGAEHPGPRYQARRVAKGAAALPRTPGRARCHARGPIALRERARQARPTRQSPALPWRLTRVESAPQVRVQRRCLSPKPCASACRDPALGGRREGALPSGVVPSLWPGPLTPPVLAPEGRARRRRLFARVLPWRVRTPGVRGRSGPVRASVAGARCRSSWGRSRGCRWPAAPSRRHGGERPAG